MAFLRQIIAAVLSACVCVAGAWAAPPTLDDFLSPADVGDVRLSPSGRYIAYVAREAAGDKLIVYDQQTSTSAAPVSFLKETKASIDWVSWKGDDRLIFAMTLRASGAQLAVAAGGGFGVAYPRKAYAIDRVGGPQTMLFVKDKDVARRSFDLTYVLDDLPADPQHILMLAPASNNGLSIYKVDVMTGDAELVEKGASGTIAWYTDRDGLATARIDMKGSSIAIMARPSPTEKWSEAIRFRAKDFDEMPEFDILGASNKPEQLYVSVAPKDASAGETSTVHIYNFATKTLGPAIWNNPKFDIDSVRISRADHALRAVCYVDDVLMCDYLDKETDALYKNLSKAFKNQRSMRLISASDDERQWIIEVTGPQEPSTIYRFDRATKSLRPLAQRWPRLAPANLAPTESISYKARDGQTIRGYLSVPPGSTGPLPLIVMPHGGPELRDSYSYDRWTQYLATRGYAVFRPNFRGSAGYGRTFTEAGHGQWGARMQDDITDGVRSLIAAGRVDPNRICIVGASYGGYAALYGGAAQPDLYKCAVSVAGISDLAAFMKWVRAFRGGESESYTFWTKLIGDPLVDSARLTDKSPISYARSYKTPLLLMHGSLDFIVPEAQSKEMNKALLAAGAPVKYVVLPCEGHHATNSSDKKILKEIEAFVAPYLRAQQLPSVAPPATPTLASQVTPGALGSTQPPSAPH